MQLHGVDVLGVIRHSVGHQADVEALDVQGDILRVLAAEKVDVGLLAQSRDVCSDVRVLIAHRSDQNE